MACLPHPYPAQRQHRLPFAGWPADTRGRRQQASLTSTWFDPPVRNSSTFRKGDPSGHQAPQRALSEYCCGDLARRLKKDDIFVTKVRTAPTADGEGNGMSWLISSLGHRRGKEPIPPATDYRGSSSPVAASAHPLTQRRRFHHLHALWLHRQPRSELPSTLLAQANYDKLMAGYKDEEMLVSKSGRPTEHFKQNWLIPKRSFPDVDSEARQRLPSSPSASACRRCRKSGKCDPGTLGEPNFECQSPLAVALDRRAYLRITPSPVRGVWLDLVQKGAGQKRDRQRTAGRFVLVGQTRRPACSLPLRLSPAPLSTQGQSLPKVCNACLVLCRTYLAVPCCSAARWWGAAAAS